MVCILGISVFDFNRKAFTAPPFVCVIYVFYVVFRLYKCISSQNVSFHSYCSLRLWKCDIHGIVITTSNSNGLKPPVYLHISKEHIVKKELKFYI